MPRQLLSFVVSSLTYIDVNVYIYVRPCVCVHVCVHIQLSGVNWGSSHPTQWVLGVNQGSKC